VGKGVAYFDHVFLLEMKMTHDCGSF